MFKYILRRLLQAIPLLLIISFVLFALLQASGDPLATLGGRAPTRAEDRARLEKLWGLDQPFVIQYLHWLIGNGCTKEADKAGECRVRLGVLRGDFGNSMVTRQPALEVISERIPNTLILMGTAQVVIVSVSLVIGVAAAIHKYSFWDNLLTTTSFVTYSVPIFLMAYILMFIFAVWLDWFPTSGMFDPAVGRTFEQVIQHLVLPVTAISLISIAGYSRFVRSSMLEVMNADYMRTARSKGLTERRILSVHGFKNASLPIVTLIGLDLPFLLAGAVVTESIFAWPGMGQTFLYHLSRSDFPVVMALLMMISVAVVLFQLLTDIVYTLLDPRIRY